MLVKRSTVDLRSCSLSGLLAGKLFWKHIGNGKTLKPLQNSWFGEMTKWKQVWIKQLRRPRRERQKGVVLITRYMDRSIRRELWSWSSSFTNLSFYTKKKNTQKPTSLKHIGRIMTTSLSTQTPGNSWKLLSVDWTLRESRQGLFKLTFIHILEECEHCERLHLIMLHGLIWSEESLPLSLTAFVTNTLTMCSCYAKLKLQANFPLQW